MFAYAVAMPIVIDFVQYLNSREVKDALNMPVTIRVVETEWIEPSGKLPYENVTHVIYTVGVHNFVSAVEAANALNKIVPHETGRWYNLLNWAVDAALLSCHRGELHV